MPDLHTFVFGMPTVGDFPTVTESSNGYCGEVSFEILNGSIHANYLNTIFNKINLRSVELDDMGSHVVEVRAFLRDWQMVE